MVKKKDGFKKLLIISMGIIILSLSGCAAIRDKIAVTKGELIGNHFVIDVYDHYGEKTMEMEGNRIAIEALDEKKKDIDEDKAGYPSSVLEITTNGKQMIQVGNTMLFKENGLDMVEDFEIPEEIKADRGGSFVPIDRYLNDIKNKLGKEKTIVISTPMGIPIGVFQGERVFVTVPDNLPKMTRLNIDGKSLYIHRANYVILDTDLIK